MASSKSSRFDPRPPDKSSRENSSARGGPGRPAVLEEHEEEPAEQYGAGEEGEYDPAGEMENEPDDLEEDLDEYDEEDEGPPEDVDFLSLLSSAMDVSREYQQRTVERPLARNYRAWKNQHAEGSKYLGTAWRGRSRLFVPKTRAAVRKNLATVAASLFSTADVVDMQAEYDDDPMQRATAAVIKADVDYRLTRTSDKSGLPWFMLAMGAALDVTLTSVCISKQFWEYEEVRKRKRQNVVVQDPFSGMPLLDPFTGEPVMDEQIVDDVRVTADRPMIELFPIENASLDPAAQWHSPVQRGRWFSMMFPMGLDDAKSMMRSAEKFGRSSGWLKVDDATLLSGGRQEDRAGARRQREGGGDRMEDANRSGDLDMVWLQENFIRISGVDWHFWSVGKSAIISEVRRVEEVYPEFGGDRPYVMGRCTIETHQIFPMSPVESWQQLQLELNDVTNLRQDTLKRAIAPLAKAKRGTNVDLAQLQRRGQPEAVLLVDNMTDVEFEATPGPSGAAYTETAQTSAMFDELAGVFSTTSVQTNRQLNETVGGMRMMSGAANSVSEFDLRVFVETWVEPVIRQIAHLVRYYESDERLLKIAAKNAQALKKFGVEPNFDHFEQVEMFVRVNAGIGAADPMQKLSKLKAAFDMLAPVMGAMAEAGITIDPEAVIDEVMGAAGFRDGRRFFKFGDPPEKAQDPETMKLMEEIKLETQKLEVKKLEIEKEFQRYLLDFRAENERNKLDNQTRIQIANLSKRAELANNVVSAQVDRERRQDASNEKNRDRMMGSINSAVDHKRRTQAEERNRSVAVQTQKNRGEGADTGAQLSQAFAAIAQRDQVLADALSRIADQLEAMQLPGMQPGAQRPPMIDAARMAGGNEQQI